MKILEWLFPKGNKNNELEKREAPELATILLKLEAPKKKTFVPIVEDCPKCATHMQFLMQVDSEQNLPHMFGDSGAGHLSFCKNHPEIMSFH